MGDYRPIDTAPRDGGLIEAGGRSYPIRTVDDVAAYLESEYPLEARG